MHAKLYKDETETDIQPKNGKDFELEEMQEIVGGYIQIVPLPRGRILICNDDGMSLGLPINKLASLAVTGYVYGDVVMGDVIICDSKMVK